MRYPLRQRAKQITESPEKIKRLLPQNSIAVVGPLSGGVLGVMPSYVPSSGLGCKLVTLFPGNHDRPTHQALIALFDQATGTPVALMDGTYITAMRTAAAAALATRLLARPDARVLTIVGTGVQSRSAQEMFPHVRGFAEVRVAGRGEFEEAVRGADVVHATTASPEPVVRFEWLSPGTHVSSVGSTLSGGSELDPETVERADVVVVEQRDSAFAPLPAGAPELNPRGRDGVVELGEILAGRADGRTALDEITLYKSVGVAVQDLAAAALVLGAARERAAGLEIELEEIHA